MTRPLDLRGKTFGLWCALRPADRRTKRGGILWECRCACGRLGFVNASNLLRSNGRKGALIGCTVCGHKRAAETRRDVRRGIFYRDVAEILGAKLC